MSSALSVISARKKRRSAKLFLHTSLGGLGCTFTLLVGKASTYRRGGSRWRFIDDLCRQHFRSSHETSPGGGEPSLPGLRQRSSRHAGSMPGVWNGAEKDLNFKLNISEIHKPSLARGRSRSQQVTYSMLANQAIDRQRPPEIQHATSVAVAR